MQSLDKKTGAILKLIFWSIFIIVLVIIIKLSYQNNLSLKEEVTNYISLEDGFKQLTKKNYEYNYVITFEDKIYYTGMVYNNYNKGVRLHNNEVINYYMNGINTYNLDNSEIIDIYGDCLYYFLDPVNIESFLMDKNYELEQLDKQLLYKYNLIWDDEPISFSIYLNSKQINLITYQYQNKTYDLKYSNIGGVKNIDINNKEF